MNTTIKSGVRWLALLALALTNLPLASAAPQLSAASLMCPNGEPFLLFGEGLDDPKLEICVTALENGTNWDAAMSLRRVLAGGVAPPANPPLDAPRVSVYTADARTAAVQPVRAGSRSDIKLVWVQTTEGVSAPLALNAPELYAVNPPRPEPGTALRVFGVNFGLRGGLAMCLVSAGGTITICPDGRSYSGEKGISPAFERTLVVPTNLPPARYRLLVNSGGGDFGWSQAFELEVVAAPLPATVFRCDAAPGEGVADAAPAIQKSIHEAALAGGGVLALKAGVFLVKKTVRVEPGVTLRGAGRNATVLVPPERDQIPKSFYHYRPVVELTDRSALEHVTVDATPGLEHHGVLIRGTTDAALRHCEVRNLTPVLRPRGQWVAADTVVIATQHTRRLVVEDCVLRGEYPFSHWGGEMADLTFRHNLCEGLPTQGASVSFHGLRRAVVEHNRITRGGRGLVVAGEAVHSYFGFNTVENIRGIANGCEMFLYEMGNALWQGAPGAVTANGFTTPGKTWDDKTLRSTADSFIFTTYAMVTTGRGLGQCLPIASFQGDAVTLARPWALAPDAASHVVVMFGCMENVHVENQFKEGVAYSGLFGAGARNVWAGDEFERVSDGMVLWSLGADAPVCLNVLRDLRLQDRGGVLLIAGLQEKKPIRGSVMLGNEIRACQVYRRERYSGNEYGLGERVWRWPYNEMPPGNARHLTFGAEAGIHLSAFFDWPGNHQDEDGKLETLPPAGRWNLVWDSLVARSPLGLRVSRGFERTTVVGLSSAFNEKSVSDSGRHTLLSGTAEQPRKP
jgi:hypothetical protein